LLPVAVRQCDRVSRHTSGRAGERKVQHIYEPEEPAKQCWQPVLRHLMAPVPAVEARGVIKVDLQAFVQAERRDEQADNSADDGAERGGMTTTAKRWRVSKLPYRQADGNTEDQGQWEAE